MWCSNSTPDWLNWRESGKGRLRPKVKCLECCGEKLIYLAMATLENFGQRNVMLGISFWEDKKVELCRGDYSCGDQR